MRTKIIQFVILFLGVLCYAQEEIVVNGNYFLDSSINLDDIQTEADNKFKVNLNEFRGKKYRLRVKAIEGDQVFFTFFNFKDSTINTKINGQKNDVVYQLSKSDFERLTSPYYNRVEWRTGFYTVPFKLRFSPFEFDANVNIGANIGAKFRWHREKKNGTALEPIFGFGLASINLNDSNSMAESATNVSAFSSNIGLLVHVNSDINIGLTFGFDFLSGNDQKKYDWQHNGNGWVGVGINIAFSKESKNTGDDNKND